MMASIWEIETAPYVPRISKALDQLKLASAKAKQIPVGPFSAPLSTEQTIA
jgi:hypothetical protein